MREKFYGWVIGTVAFALCCLGIPILIGAISAGAFSWLFGPVQGLALVLAAMTIVAFRRSYLHRRKYRKQRDDGVEPRSAIHS